MQGSDVWNSIYAAGGHGGQGGPTNIPIPSGDTALYAVTEAKGGLGSSLGGRSRLPTRTDVSNQENSYPGSAQASNLSRLAQVNFTARLSAGSGGGGGSVLSTTSGGNYRTNLGASGGTSPYGNGGTGGNSEGSNFGTGVAGSGGSGTGNGAGGGGGGASTAGINVTSGAGGAGSAGRVIIYF